MPTDVFLPGLWNDANDTPREHAHRPVRETSMTAYKLAADTLKGRAKEVASALECYTDSRNVPPTSGELAKWLYPAGRGNHDWTAALLYVRRGLSDLAKRGLIETVPSGARTCSVVFSRCNTWRVRSR